MLVTYYPAISLLSYSGWVIPGLSFNLLMVMFVMVFVVLLWIDFRLFQSALITQDYFQTRCIVSAIVIASLIIAEITS